MYRYLFRTVHAARSSSVRVCERTVFPAKCDKAAVFRVGTGGGVKTLSTSSVRLCEKKDDVVLSNQDEKANADPTETPALAQQKAEEDGEVLNMAEQRDEPAVLKTGDGSTMQQQVDEKIKEDVAKPEQKAEEDGEVLNMAEQRDEPAVLKTDDGSTMQQQVDEKIKEDVAKPEQKAEEDGEVLNMAEQRDEPAVLKTDDGSTMQQVDEKIKEDVAKPEQVMTDAAKSGKASLLDLLGAMKVEVTNKRRLKSLKAQKNYESTPRSNPAAMESTISMFQKATEEASSQSETLDPELLSAASAAAQTLPDRSQAESELLKQLRQHEAITEAQKKGDLSNLGVIIADMKVGKNPNRQNARPANQIQFDEDGRGYTHERGVTAELDSVRRRSLFRGKRFNMFSPTTDKSGEESAVARPTLWDMDFAHGLSLSVNHTPRNGLDEMIQWTKEGKMWQYPVNNEAGLEEEASVPFHEHVFLDVHLKEGFPRQGPVRHFMELVVAGLSRNPYLTVQQKREHISWFRDYFHQKEDVLKEAEVYLN